MAKGVKTGGRDFKPGEGGRPKGSRNRLGEAIAEATGRPMMRLVAAGSVDRHAILMPHDQGLWP